MTHTRLTFTIVLRPLARCADPIRALRRLLKYALRVCGLKCVDVRQEEKQP
jgi:hypothetical protein